MNGTSQDSNNSRRSGHGSRKKNSDKREYGRGVIVLSEEENTEKDKKHPPKKEKDKKHPPKKEKDKKHHPKKEKGRKKDQKPPPQHQS
jgi:hypothetical protein